MRSQTARPVDAPQRPLPIGMNPGRPQSPPVIIASVQALMQRTFSLLQLAAHRVPVMLGQRLDLQDFYRPPATGLGYHAEYQVNEPGDMAMRGGIVDFFPLDRDDPVRVEFSGDEIESIRTFDPITQQSRDKREPSSSRPPANSAS